MGLDLGDRLAPGDADQVGPRLAVGHSERLQRASRGLSTGVEQLTATLQNDDKQIAQMEASKCREAGRLSHGNRDRRERLPYNRSLRSRLGLASPASSSPTRLKHRSIPYGGWSISRRCARTRFSSASTRGLPCR